MKMINKSLKVNCNIILTTIIIFGIIFVGLFCFGIVPYVVESGSMEPDIKTGSICFINKNAKYEDMQVGDVIAFEINSGAFATHRIVSISNEGFTTKGDANNLVDSIITTRDNFIGKNVISIPNVGIIIKVLQTAKGRVILTTIIVALLALAILIGKPEKNS